MNFKNYIYSLEKKPSILFEQIRTRSNIFLHLYHFTILLYEKLINLHPDFLLFLHSYFPTPSHDFSPLQIQSIHHKFTTSQVTI